MTKDKLTAVVQAKFPGKKVQVRYGSYSKWKEARDGRNEPFSWVTVYAGDKEAAHVVLYFGKQASAMALAASIVENPDGNTNRCYDLKDGKVIRVDWETYQPIPL